MIQGRQLGYSDCSMEATFHFFAATKSRTLRMRGAVTMSQCIAQALQMCFSNALACQVGFGHTANKQLRGTSIKARSVAR